MPLVEEGLLMKEEAALFGLYLALGIHDLNSLAWAPFKLQALITEVVPQLEASWICLLPAELAHSSLREGPAFLSICLSMLCDHASAVYVRI